MGRSRRSTAAVALILGCVLPIAAGLAAPAHAVPKKPPANPASGPSWAIAKGERLIVEPTRGTEGVALAGVGSFRGKIEVVRTARGVSVVNDVAFEDYIRGISEVPNNWPLEALKAQAIAARTYALWELRRQSSGPHRAAGADICATQSCQVYTGLTKERATDGNRWVAAAQATEHEVLWWRDGPINAKYSSSNGGQSVPGAQPYLRAVNDPDDAHSPLHRWQVTASAAEVAAALGFPGKQVTAIQRLGDDILVTAKFQPYDLEEEPSHATLHAVDFRDRVNEKIARPENVPRTLPTARFSPKLITDPATEQLKVVFDGRGWGHGIGLSQWGAFGKAARGMKAPDILAAYYSGLKPTALPASHLPGRIKVAVALDAPVVTLAPADPGGRIQIESSNGEVLAYGAGTSKPWTVKPAKDGLSVVSPADEAILATVTATEADPHALGRPVEVRVRLSHDAHLVVTATAPGSAPALPVGEPQVFGAGDVLLRLPATAIEGDYNIAIETDRGGGRRSGTSLAVPVSAGAAGLRAHGGQAASGAATTARLTSAARGAGAPLAGTIVAALAILAFLGVGLSAARTALGRSAASQLH